MHVERLCLSDHYGVFCNRKSQSNISKNIHPIITYRSSRNFEENRFLNDLYSVSWEIIEQFDNLDDIVSKILSEYDQEIPQSQTADYPVAPRGRAAQPSRDTRKTN